MSTPQVTTPSRLGEVLQRPGKSTRARVLSILGILLVPFVIAGVLVWALWNPTDRLNTVPAAIVNLDEPVTINGQLAPLGRQLSAGLVGSPNEVTKNNYDWSITDADAAASGLADGTYLAVVTIPKGFSAAATSLAGSDPRKATIDVTTAKHSGLVDDAITATIASAAASLTGTQLTTTYLDNLYVGFNTLGEQLGEAQKGAVQLADGATSLGEGVTTLNEGVGKLGDGATQLDSGAKSLASGAQGLAAGTAGVSEGATKLAQGIVPLESGAQGVAGGARDLAQGLSGFATTLTDTSGATQQAGAGLGQLNSLLTSKKAEAAAVAANAQTVNSEIAALAANCAASGATPAFCSSLTASAVKTTALEKSAGVVSTGYPVVADQLHDSLTGVSGLLLGLGKVVQDEMAAPAAEIAGGAEDVSGGITALRGGADQLASGAGQLNSGAGQLSSGAGQLASGTSGLSTGIGALQEGLPALGDGTSKLAEGITTLGDGLGTAVEALPSYSSSERAQLSKVVANPVITGDDATTSIGSGLGAIGGPFYAVLALWLGALASLLVLRAVPRGIMNSTRGSLSLTLRAFAPIAAIGALQGVLVGALLQSLLKLDAGAWVGFALVAALAGIAFAAVNQALTAIFGGAGRFISMVVALVVLATGIISTVPGALTAIAAALPIDPALTALRGVVGGIGIGGAIAALILWTVLALLATTFAIRFRRTRPVVVAPAVAA